MFRRPPRSTQDRWSAASDVYKRQLFRITLEHADQLRASVLHWAHPRGAGGVIAVVSICALATAAAAALVRRFPPFAGGSGVPPLAAVLLAP